MTLSARPPCQMLHRLPNKRVESDSLRRRFARSIRRYSRAHSVMKVLFLSIALALTGCATTPVPATSAKQAPADRVLAFQTKPEGPSGKLIVTRDEGFLGGGCFYALSIALSINGTVAARLDVGETSAFFVSPGEVLLLAGRDPQGKALCALGQDEWTQRETLVRDKETKYFRLSIDMNGKTAATLRFTGRCAKKPCSAVNSNVGQEL